MPASSERPRGSCPRSLSLCRNLEWPLVLLGCLGQLGDGRGEVRSEGSINVRLQSAQVNLESNQTPLHLMLGTILKITRI